MGTALHLALLVPVAIALLSSGATYWQGWAYFSEEGTPHDAETEAVSIIVPLRGKPHGIADLLDRLLEQDGVGPVEAIVAVEEGADPATDQVRALAKSRDRLRVVVAEEQGVSGTGKIANLIAGVSEARYDRLVFVDADVQVAPGAVRRLLAPLSDPSVGLVFAAQVGADSPNLPAAFNHVFVNDSAFLHGAAAYRGELPGAVGAFMATRRDVLEAVGGLSRFADQIVMDIPLGQAVQGAGFDLHLLRRPVRVGGGPETWRTVLRRHHRWMVTIRTYLPRFPAFVAGASLPETWSLAFLATAGALGAHVPLGLVGLGVVLAWKVGSLAFANARLVRDEGLWPRLWVALVAELLWLGVFLWSLSTNRVYWAGRQFEVAPDGTKKLLVSSSPQATER